MKTNKTYIIQGYVYLEQDDQSRANFVQFTKHIGFSRVPFCRAVPPAMQIKNRGAQFYSAAVQEQTFLILR